MPFYERGPVRIHYEEAGAGFPLLVIPGGGLNATIAYLSQGAPFNPMEEFRRDYRCITMDLRNANGGTSSGPVEIDRPWDAYTDDQLGLMDHLGIKEFMVLGFCIGGPFIWNMLRRAPERVTAGVLAQPSGFRPEVPDLFYQNNLKGWGPGLCAQRPDVTMEMVDAFLKRMYGTNPDFVFTVTGILCATARRRSWCCRTMCRRIPTPSQWRRCTLRRMPKSASIRGRTAQS